MHSREKDRKTYTTAAVIVLPPSIWPPIQQLRQQYDRHVHRWMPHITLVYPFRPRDDWVAMVPELDVACAAFVPFQVELSAWGVFTHGQRSATVYLAPEPQARLVELQTTVWRVVPDLDDTRRRATGFTPHLTIGQARGREQAAALIAHTQALWQPLSFRVEEIQLIWRREPPDDMFRVGQTVKLGRG